MEMENKAAADEKNDAVPIELPAPPGWKKRFTPRKSSTPRRNDIVFVSPDGDEIKNKRQLEKYLKSHPGGPSASEFHWGTGDTPRRSTRLGEKSKATETPESDTPSKRQRKSSSKKGAEDDGEQEAEGATEKETKASDEPAMPNAEDLEVQDVEIASKNLTDGDNIKDEKEKTSDGEIVPDEPPASEDKMEIVQEKEETKDDEEKPNDVEIVPEEPPASEDAMEIVQEKEETLDEGNIEKLKNREAEDKPLDNSLKTDNKTLQLNMFEEDKIESKPAGTDASSLSAEFSKATSASQEEIAEDTPATADTLNVLEENKIESKSGADASSHSAELSKATSVSQEEIAEEAPAAADTLNVLEENKIESKTTGADALSHSAELSKATSVSQEEIGEEAPAAADTLNVLEENKIESKTAGTDASSHSAELSKATSISQEEAPAAADPLVQNTNDGKVHENEQIDREIPIEEINGTEAATAGVNNSVENNSLQ